MSLSSKITDDDMRFFQFRARQLYQLQKEDHEWNEFCKRTACTCCSCQTNLVPKLSKEVGIQSSPRRNLPTTAKSTVNTVNPYNKNLPQTLNEIKVKLEKIDLALSEIKVPTKSERKDLTKPKEIFNQPLNSLTFPLESDMADSVKSVINDRRMKLIQDSLKMSLQRLRSAALRNTKPNSNVKVKQRSSGYFIPRDLERQRASARRAYLASLDKTVVESKITNSNRRHIYVKKDNLKPKSLKAAAKSNLRKINKIDNQKATESTLVKSNQPPETKDENIEAAVDAIMDDILGETVLVINKVKQSKSEKSSTMLKNTEHAPNVSLKNISMDLHSKEAEDTMVKQFHSKLEKIRTNLDYARKGIHVNGKLELGEINSITKEVKSADESEQLTTATGIKINNLEDTMELRNAQPLRNLSIGLIKAKEISEGRKKYWSYLERISRTRKGNFDPWDLSNLLAESLLDDCIQEVAEELQDVPASLIADLYDQEFLQSI